MHSTATLEAPVEQATVSPLVARLQAAAVEAIANERPGLEYEPERLKGVVIELEMRGAGVYAANCYVQRRGKSRKEIS